MSADKEVRMPSETLQSSTASYQFHILLFISPFSGVGGGGM